MSRLRWIRLGLVVACCTFAARSIAGPREEVLARAARCASIVEDAAWLACYRAAAAPMEASLAAASAPARVSAPATPATPATPAAHAADAAGFGNPDRLQVNPLTAPAAAVHPAPETSSTDHLTAHVLKVSFSTQNYFTLVLDNGQVWQQINGDNDFAVLKAPAQEYEVTIRHGFFGSYNLTFAGVAGLFRVRRIA